MLSAPAAIPATNDITFEPASYPGPRPPATVSRSAISPPRPARSANASTGTSPPAASRFASSNAMSVTETA